MFTAILNGKDQWMAGKNITKTLTFHPNKRI